MRRLKSGARFFVGLSLIALYKALGGGWQMRGGQVFVAEETQQEMQERTNWGSLLPERPDAPAEERDHWWWPLW